MEEKKGLFEAVEGRHAGHEGWQTLLQCLLSARDILT